MPDAALTACNHQNTTVKLDSDSTVQVDRQELRLRCSLQCWTDVSPGLALQGIIAVCMKVAEVVMLPFVHMQHCFSQHRRSKAMQ